jgi:hypothetical protein
MSADRSLALAGEVRRLAEQGRVSEAVAVLRSGSDVSGPEAIGLGWYVLAPYLEGAAAEEAYVHAAECGTLEVRAWAGVQRGHLLAASGNRGAAQSVLRDAVRLGDRDATVAAIDALESLTNWAPPVVNVLLAIMAMGLGAVLGARLADVSVPVSQGGDPGGYGAAFSAAIAVLCGWLVYRASPPAGVPTWRTRIGGMWLCGLGVAMTAIGALAVLGRPAALHHVEWIGAWADLADSALHPSPEGSLISAAERYLVLPAGALVLIYLFVCAADPAPARAWIRGRLYANEPPRFSLVLTGRAKQAVFLFGVAAISALLAATTRATFGF